MNQADSLWRKIFPDDLFGLENINALITTTRFCAEHSFTSRKLLFEDLKEQLKQLIPELKEVADEEKSKMMENFGIFGLREFMQGKIFQTLVLNAPSCRVRQWQKNKVIFRGNSV